MKYCWYMLFAVCMLPQIAHAAVRITEVAWMGTTDSQYSEWLELYNDGDTSLNLAGWKLYEGDGGALVFTLTKSIATNGYLLIERTTASAPDAVSGINDEAGSFGASGLANTGEHLVLKDSSGTTVDELDYLDGWPGGDATTKETMQRAGESWITAPATPKAPVSGDGETSVDEDEQKLAQDPHPIPKTSPNKPSIVFTVPPVVYRGVEYEFGAEPVLEYNYRINKGAIYWNFGDGVTMRGDEVRPARHTYHHTGTYTMYVSFSDAITKNAPLIGTKKIRVIEPALTATLVGKTAIELTNASSMPIDLSGWKALVDGRYVSIPEMTIVADKSTATIPLIALGISSASSMRMVDPSGALVADTKVQSTPVRTVPVEDVPSVQKEEYEFPTEDLVASASDIESKPSSSPIHNRTKTIVFGAVVLFVIGLSILLERAMARREYQ